MIAFLENLTNPGVIGFSLGGFAALVRSDLKVPAPVHDALSMVLLFAIGLKGGIAMRYGADLPMIQILAGAAIGLTSPLIAYWIARRIGLMDVPNAAGMAATYGSVSAVTYMAGLQFADTASLKVDATLPIILVILEMLALILALGLVSRHKPSGGNRFRAVIHESLCGQSILLLVGGLLIGSLCTEKALGSLKAGFIIPMEGFLVFFLLELGILAANTIREARSRLPFLIPFGTLLPIALGVLGVFLGKATGMGPGGAATLGTLAASGSYIAAPAMLRTSIPEADPALYLTAALGITLPFNLGLGIPLYFTLAQKWIG